MASTSLLGDVRRNIRQPASVNLGTSDLYVAGVTDELSTSPSLGHEEFGLQVDAAVAGGEVQKPMSVGMGSNLESVPTFAATWRGSWPRWQPE